MASDDGEPHLVEVDEVLPPGAPEPTFTQASPSRGAKAAVKKAFPGFMARVLDDLVVIPKTKYRIGLDPIIGFFFPVVGDVVTAGLGSTILGEALRRQVPREVAIRMGGNILINAAVGAIPVFGDLFSIWYKSNARNHALLKKHSEDGTYPEVKSSMWPLFLFLLGVIAVIALVVTGVVAIARWIF